MSITTSSDNKSANAGAFQQSALGARIAYPNYKYTLTATYNEFRTVAFNLTIQALNPDGTKNTTYVPQGNVALSLKGGASGDSISPATTDATGWVTGAKTVSVTIAGGSAPESIPAIRAWEVVQKVYGTTTVYLTPKLPPAFCALSNVQTQTIIRICNSQDGINWYSGVVSPNQTTAFRGVCWSPQLGILCAISHLTAAGSVYIFTSPNGVIWTQKATLSATANMAICWSKDKNLFCVVGSDGSAFTSPNGREWLLRSTPTGTWTAVIWSPELSLFCAVGNDTTNNSVMTSPDGTTWTGRGVVGTTALFAFYGIAWSPALSLFVGCGASPGAAEPEDTEESYLISSTDGITWTNFTSNEPSDLDLTLNSITWSKDKGLFCATGSWSGAAGSTPCYTSTNGTSWTQRTMPDASLNSIAWSSGIGLFCAVGNTSYILTSPDGVTWTLRTALQDNNSLGTICSTDN